MADRQKNILFLLIILGTAYFILFLFPNLTGARDANMLAIFEVDEYAQFPHLVGMLEPGPTLYQTVRNFLIYLHYFYGYPFYFFSALAVLPIRLLLGANWAAATPVIMVTLRQAINVLPMILGALVLVYSQTRFHSWWRAMGLFLVLVSVPAVFVNNLWWHPDSLVFLFIALTIFFLDRDAFRFGANFFLAAAACGLAIGTKHLGALFVLAVPLYIVWGVWRKSISWKRGLLSAAGFVLVMLLAVVVSNPLLLLPQERAEIIRYQRMQFEQTSTGIISTTSDPYFQLGQYPEDFRIHYGEAIFMALALLALGVGIAQPESRRLNVIILAWAIPMAAVITFVATRRTHYFLPVMLPLFSSLVHLFPSITGSHWKKSIQLIRQVVLALAALLILLQCALFVRTDITIYTRQLRREDTSPAVNFYRTLEQQVLPDLALENPVVYRDWRIYVPPQPGWQIEMSWDLPSIEYIQELNPDLVLVEQANIGEYVRPDALAEAVNPEHMARAQAFYQAVAQDDLAGYDTIYEDDYGIVLVRR